MAGTPKNPCQGVPEVV